MVERIRQGKPVIIHGDGTSLWTMTHNTDFAKAFCGLMGNVHAIGETYQITSDESLTWNQIYEAIAAALQRGAAPRAHRNRCSRRLLQGFSRRLDRRQDATP